MQLKKKPWVGERMPKFLLQMWHNVFFNFFIGEKYEILTLV